MTIDEKYYCDKCETPVDEFEQYQIIEDQTLCEDCYKKEKEELILAGKGANQ